jgi:hypothetical protein
MFGFRSASSAYVAMQMVVGFSLAAVVNQIAIALCRRAQAAAERLVVGECAVTPLSPRHSQH